MSVGELQEVGGYDNKIMAYKMVKNRKRRKPEM